MTTARRQILFAGAGLGLAFTGRLLAEAPDVVEWHRVRAFPAVAALLQRGSGTMAGTLGEAGAAILIVAAIVLLVRRPRALGAITFMSGILVLTFYLLWGFAYRYPSLSGRLAPLPENGEVSGSALAELAERAVALTARASEGALSLSGSDAAFLSRINAGLDEGFRRWPASLEAAPVRGFSFGPVKPSRVSFAMSRLQLSGYYFPWTGEAQLNAEMPRTLWPRVGAHEKAHQRGFTRENEATVIGLITCLGSDEPTVFYSGALGLFVALDHELARSDREGRRRIWRALSARVAEDLGREAAFWKAREGVGGVVSEKVNDTYLKAQGVRSGVGSYAETTKLILQALNTDTLEIGRRLPPLASSKPE